MMNQTYPISSLTTRQYHNNNENDDYLLAYDPRDHFSTWDPRTRSYLLPRLFYSTLTTTTPSHSHYYQTEMMNNTNRLSELRITDNSSTNQPQPTTNTMMNNEDHSYKWSLMQLSNCHVALPGP